MQRDEETGFSYHGTRYYAAWLGRWITPDTIGVAGGICLYEYSAGNPIRLIDVDGRNPQPPDKRPVTARDLHQLRKAGNAKPVKLQPAAKAPKGRLFDSKLLRATFFALSVITGKRVLPEDSKFPIETVRKHEDKIKGAKKKGAGGNPKPKPPQPSGVADKRLVTARDLHELRNTGNASAVEPVAPEPVKGGGGGSGSGRGAGGGKTSGFPRMPVAGAVAGGAGVASVAGSVIRDLHEGNTTKAVTEAATGTGAAMVLTRVPALAPLAVMVGTIEAYDDNVKRDATAAGSWVEDKTGSHTLGAVSASATATGKSAFEGTFGVVGRNIGEGAAAGYIRATSDEYTMIPWKTQVWADAAKKISSFRYAAWAW
jgi:RHS repeat-associated protein